MNSGNNHNRVHRHEHRQSQNGDIKPRVIVTLFSVQLMSNNHKSFTSGGAKVIFVVCLAVIVTALTASKKNALKLKIKLD